MLRGRVREANFPRGTGFGKDREARGTESGRPRRTTRVPAGAVSIGCSSSGSGAAAERGPSRAAPLYSGAMKPTIRIRPTLLACALALLVGAPAGAQEDDSDLRVGLVFGGTSVFGVVVEHLEGRRGIELTVGTWNFRNVSLSAVAKAYLGPSAFRPALGAGLWAVMGLRPQEGERGGAALIARFPIGFDWRVVPGHYLGMEVDVNRALWMRRADFSELPPSPRTIPIPAMSYRFGS